MKNFFKDQNGKLSMMRLKTLSLILAGIFIAIYQSLNQIPVDHIIVLEFVGLGLGFKIWQKMEETKQK